MKRRLLVLAVPLVVVLGAVVLVWFQPQKLFIDERVEDTIPVVPAMEDSDDSDEATPGTSEPSAPVLRASGEFVSLDHATSGKVRVLELADGERVVRLEGLDTDNGPDLFLYLSTTPADGAESAFDDDFVNLGRMKGNQGDQNYELPADVDLSRFRSVVIWCDRFNSAFGAADLSA